VALSAKLLSVSGGYWLIILPNAAPPGIRQDLLTKPGKMKLSPSIILLYKGKPCYVYAVCSFYARPSLVCFVLHKSWRDWILAKKSRKATGRQS
jgi:hypothetical protein